MDSQIDKQDVDVAEPQERRGRKAGYIYGGSPWNVPERVERFRDLYDDGYSFSEIAALLGDGLTRNACISKAKRLKFPGRGQKERAVRIRRARSVPQRRVTNADGPAAIAILPLPPERDEDIPVEQRKTLMELENHHCRWPVGDAGKPGFFFCGSPLANVSDGTPYCPHHHALAYDGIPEPKRKAPRRFNTNGMPGVAR